LYYDTIIANDTLGYSTINDDSKYINKTCGIVVFNVGTSNIMLHKQKCFDQSNMLK